MALFGSLSMEIARHDAGICHAKSSAVSSMPIVNCGLSSDEGSHNFIIACMEDRYGISELYNRSHRACPSGCPRRGCETLRHCR